MAKHRDSPRTTTRKLLQYATTKAMKNTLLFHHTLVASMKARYAATKSQRMKQVYARMLTGSLLRRYRMQKYSQQVFGLSRRMWRRSLVTSAADVGYIRKKSTSLGTRMKAKVTDFFIRDDVSRLTTGVRRTIVRNKVKQQKRLMNDTLHNLYRKYLSENPSDKLSFALFCKLRPFWVVVPREQDRDTCLCKLCENFGYMVKSLIQSKILMVTNVHHLVESVTCDTASKACMYGECDECSHVHESTGLLLDKNMDNNETTKWREWATIKELRVIGDNTRSVTLTVRKERQGT